MTFKQAKAVIRGALAEATPAKLIEVLEAARAGEVPFADHCSCFACHLLGPPPIGNGRWWTLSDAFFELDPTDDGYSGEYYGDARRQRILVAMVLAEIRRRNRRNASAHDLDDAETVTVRELFTGVR